MAVLIAIEGIDGAGKGTQTALLCTALKDRGLCVGAMQFPRYGRTVFGRAIGDFLNGRFGSLNEVHPLLASVLYAGDRFESRDELAEQLRTNDVVVLDRFVGSNLAHQGAKLEGAARAELIAWIESVEHGVFGLPRPELTLLIDIPPRWSRELVGRKSARDYTDQKADLHESDQSYLACVRDCYRELADQRADWVAVSAVSTDGELRSITEIHNDLMQQILMLPNLQQ